MIIDEEKINKIKKFAKDRYSVDIEKIEIAGDLISAPKAAKILGVNPQTVRNWAENGKLKPDRVNNLTGHKFYSKSKILKLIIEE